MPTGFTTITAAKIQNASGKLLPAGRVKFFPIGTSSPVSVIAGGGGLIMQEAVTFLVVNGAITTDIYGATPQVADSSLTTPANIAYRVTVWDDDLGAEVQGPGYGLVQPSGSTWSLDTYVPVQPLQLTVQAGPAGVPGASGPPITFRGPYSGGTTYALGDGVSFNGSSYVSLVAANIGHQPDTSTAQWGILASAGAIGPAGSSTGRTVVVASASGASQAITMLPGETIYDITLSTNCAISIAPTASTTIGQRVTLVIRPAGFTATLPASSSSLAWAGGSPPPVSTSAITVISFLYAGTNPILGGL